MNESSNYNRYSLWCKKGFNHLHNYFELFYRDVFFPTLENKIDTVIHMGDIFDSRKSIDYQVLNGQRSCL